MEMSVKTIQISCIFKECMKCRGPIEFDMDFDIGIGNRCLKCDEILCDECFENHVCEE